MRLMHTMLRVLDLDKSIEFYQGVLGMRLLKKLEFPDGKFTLAFLGYGPEPTHTVLELTYNWDQKEPYTTGSGYGHIALETSDIYATSNKLKSAGAMCIREPGPMKHGTTHIAFFKDPDNCLIELVQPDWLEQPKS